MTDPEELDGLRRFRKALSDKVLRLQNKAFDEEIKILDREIAHLERMIADLKHHP